MTGTPNSNLFPLGFASHRTVVLFISCAALLGLLLRPSPVCASERGADRVIAHPKPRRMLADLGETCYPILLNLDTGDTLRPHFSKQTMHH